MLVALALYLFILNHWTIKSVSLNSPLHLNVLDLLLVLVWLLHDSIFVLRLFINVTSTAPAAAATFTQACGCHRSDLRTIASDNIKIRDLCLVDVHFRLCKDSCKYLEMCAVLQLNCIWWWIRCWMDCELLWLSFDINWSTYKEDMCQESLSHFRP